MKPPRLLLAGLALAAAVTLAGQDLFVGRPRPILIVGGTLIDGTGAPPRRNDAILIRGGRIAAIGLSASQKAPDNARLIDAAGKWILPGFIDAAVHLSVSGEIGAPSESAPNASSAEIRRAPAAYLRAYLCAGITTVLNIDGPPSTFDLRDGRADDPLSPRIETTGPTLALVLTAQPGGVARGGELSAAGPHGAALLVSRLARSHPALVSVRVSPPATPGAGDTFRSAGGVAADARRLRVIAEAATTAELRSAVESGVDAVVSRISEPIDDAIVQRIVTQRVAILPIMVVDDARRRMASGDASAADFEAGCAPEASLASLAALKSPGPTARSEPTATSLADEVEGQQRNVRRLEKAGAVIVAGSGGGAERVFHGPSLHREFELLDGAGLVPMQVVLSATQNAAVLLGQGTDTGQIREGMRADVILLGADPLSDVRNARRVILTIRGGALYER